MTVEYLKQLVKRIIIHEQWENIVSRFRDVLRVNIFIVDYEGIVVTLPIDHKYGGRLLTNPSLEFHFLGKSVDFMDQFKVNGNLLECVNRFDLHSFAIPIRTKEKTIAYMIVGPVILNRRLNSVEYKKMSETYGGHCHEELCDEINEVRVVSNIMMNSILDLLQEVIKGNVELREKGFHPSQEKQKSQDLPKEVVGMVKEIDSPIDLDELLVSLLDVALDMTSTECGSIMIVDKDQKQLNIKVSRGLDLDKVGNTPISIGEGVAGLAAQKKSSYLLEGQRGENQVRSLLKRPEIKRAIVMPLSSKNRVFGVLNLHTKKDQDRIKENLPNLQYFSQLLASVF